MVNRIGSEMGTEQVARNNTPSTASAGKTVSKVSRIEPVSEALDQSKDAEEKLTLQEADGIVEGMNEFLSSVDSKLKFVLHEDLDEYYVTIIDSKTDEVIREIPSKKLLDIHASIREFVGLLVDRKI